MSMSSSSSNTPAGGTPSKQQRGRMPLTELPIANYIIRSSSSPTKTQSTSPNKISSSSLLPSPKLARPSTNRSTDLPYDKRLNLQGGELLRSGSTSPISPKAGSGEGTSSDSSLDGHTGNKNVSPFPINSKSSSKHIKSTTLSDLPLEESPAISDEIQHTKSSPASNLRKLRQARAKVTAGKGIKTSPNVSTRTKSNSSHQSIGRIEGEFEWKPEDLITPPLKQYEDGESFEGGLGTSSNLPKSVPQSLPRKKDRVRPSEVAHLLMDQDEDQSALDRGSPSPQKDATKNTFDSPSMLTSITTSSKNDGFAVPKNVANKGFAIGLGIDHPLNVAATANSNAISWTVLPDSDQEDQLNDSSIKSSDPSSSSSQQFVTFDNTPEADKENSKPDPVILRGRKKGTGGRLSLVATAAQADEGNTSIETAQ